MKKTSSAVLLIITISLMLILSGCYKDRMLKYYNDDSIYETLDVAVLSIDEEYMEVEFLNEVHEHYTYAPFHLINCPDLKTRLNVGDIISIITAPRFFWDNYRIPIVGITKGDIVYLEYKTGKQNLLDYIENTQS